MNSIFDVPFYRPFKESGIPVIDKEMIKAQFPDSFLTPEVKKALADGEAQYVTTTGTNHDRMQLIRPKFFLLKQYFDIWKHHPDLSASWVKDCPRVSLTTYRATQHVTSKENPTVQDRTFGEKTLYINMSEDPGTWDRKELLRMLEEISQKAPYHLDCDPVYLAVFMAKLKQEGLWHLFKQPETTIHAYEIASRNTSGFIQDHLNGPVVNLYGSTELGFLFSHSSSGIRESYLDHIDIEYEQVSDQAWSMIISSTRNPYMPLIRYRCGDCVEFESNTPQTLAMTRILGREKEIVTGRKQRYPHIHFDDLVSEVSSDLFIYRLDLKDTNEFFYNTFSGEPLTQAQHSIMHEKLNDALGTRTSVNFRSHLPPVASGKYPWVTFHKRSFDG